MGNTWGDSGKSVRLYFLGSKITVDGYCSHEIKRLLLLGRKVMTNLGSILKIRDITLPTKVHLVKAMVFPVVTCGCESWTVKKVECQKIDAFELWCWRRLLRVPWDCREIQPVHPKGDQSWVFIGRTDVEAETLNTLATSGEELTHWKRPWCWEGLGAGGEGGDRGWDGWMALPTRWAWVWVNSGSWWWTGRPGVLRFMGLQRVGHDWVTELIWTELRTSYQISVVVQWLRIRLLCRGQDFDAWFGKIPHASTTPPSLLSPHATAAEAVCAGASALHQE